MDSKELQKLADLARIDIEADELKKLQKDMEAILKYVSRIEEVAVNREDELISTTDAFLREDGNPHETGVFSKEILKEVPKTKDGYVEVKKIISQ
ncbi:MAG: Asp-tRNA(Asn)/Glu-tRNA(Gln) amidotransferase subunit GatC [bacterium]|nr:Asp-tRNA(Asn)/Glu-tRNA(Gln) amidotransferase subunit GatC [bacterium]